MIIGPRDTEVIRTFQLNKLKVSIGFLQLLNITSRSTHWGPLIEVSMYYEHWNVYFISLVYW